MTNLCNVTDCFINIFKRGYDIIYVYIHSMQRKSILNIYAVPAGQLTAGASRRTTSREFLSLHNSKRRPARSLTIGQVEAYLLHLKGERFHGLTAINRPCIVREYACFLVGTCPSLQVGSTLILHMPGIFSTIYREKTLWA